MPKTARDILLPDTRRISDPGTQAVFDDLLHVLEEVHRQVFGDLIGQAIWVDQTANRAAGTVYQNTSGGRKWVSIVVKGATTGTLVGTLAIGSTSPPALIVDQTAVRVNSAANEHEATLVTLLPKDWYYKLTLTVGTLVAFFEYDD